MSKSDFEYSGLELEAMSIAENYRKYWASKLPPLPNESHVLEVGAGIGSNVPIIMKHFNHVFLIEPDLNQQRVLNDKFKDQAHPNRVTIVSSYEELANKLEFNLILYVDVLEHISDDFSEIELATSRLSSNGYIFIVVPAFPALYSNYDRKLSHYRRYTKKRLLQIVETRYEISELIYIDAIGILGVFGNKICGNSNLNVAAVRFWDSILIPISRIIDQHITRYKFGKSLLLVARKRS